jgi:tetratricopeptide (TPR) repeat protein
LLAAGRREEGASALAAYRASYEREQAVVRAEGLVRAQLDQGWSLLRESRNNEAAAVFGQLGEGAEALEGLARSEAARGRHPEAVAILERAVSRYPDHPGLQRLLALERLAVLGREP